MSRLEGILPFYEVVDARSITSIWAQDWSLPGQGEKYDDCGSFGVRGCLERGDHHEKTVTAVGEDGKEYSMVLPEGGIVLERFKRSCNRAECPVCYEKWAGKEVGAIVHRLEKFREQENPNLKVVHVIASVPEDILLKSMYSYANTSTFRVLRNMAYDVLKGSGVMGGACIYHPYRRRCRFCGCHPIPSNDDPSCPECGSKSFVWYFSPHFHVLGFGWVARTKEIEAETGWVVKNLGVRKSVGGTALYQLSHAGVHKDIYSVSWFGSLSYSEFYCVDPPPRDSEKCPYCDRVLRPVRYVGLGSNPLPREEGTYYLKSDDWVYAVQLVIFGGIPEEFRRNPRCEDGSINWAPLLKTE